MDVSECTRKGFIKKTTPSISLIKSLIEVSKAKETAIQTAKIDEITVNAYLPLAYDALRELLEALCILLGYKVTNYVCLGELLRTLDSDFDYHGFDRFRFARNGINYYGKQVELTEGKEIIKRILQMRKDILIKLQAKIK